MMKPDVQALTNGVRSKQQSPSFLQGEGSEDEQQHYAHLLVQLMNKVLQADTLSEAIQPILDAFVDHSTAQGAFYLKADSLLTDTLQLAGNRPLVAEKFSVWDSVGRLPQGAGIRDVLDRGLAAQDNFMTALQRCVPILIVNDTTADTSTSAFVPLGIGSLAAAPVYSDTQLAMGVFVVYREQAQPWTTWERALFRAVSMTPVALAARFVDQEHIKQTYEDAIHALGLVLEYRDDDTKGHTDRVTELCLRIADALMLDDNACDALRRGAYLHDIGKIAIPDAILRKPGNLNEAEWVLMRTHTMIGYEFVQNLSFLPQAARDVVLYHHEKYDGTGYPHGLSGQDIPLLARIFAVADVYDALISLRPYKAAWQHDDAMGEIRKMSGTHFDPEVVTVFETLF
ncbi:MAG: HD-GYP domain-containing protein [Deinococcota bacterium]